MSLQAELTSKEVVEEKVQEKSIVTMFCHFWTERKIYFVLSIPFVVSIIVVAMYSVNYLAYRVTQASTNLSTTPRECFTTTEWSSETIPCLIDTPTCRLKDWPLFDDETQLLYKCTECEEGQRCGKNLPPFSIRRVNFTWVQIDFPAKASITDHGWQCYASEIIRTNKDDYELGAEVGPLGAMNNFAHNVTEWKANETVARWDSVKVTCKDGQLTFSRIVPLVQHYRRNEANQTGNQTQVNVVLLHIDSVSRLNFLRHMPKTKQFLVEHDFIPLFGYHKVGINSFPNVMSIFTGHHVDYYCNNSNEHCSSSGFTFDHFDLIFKHFQSKNYMTTFIEDMPKWGLFASGDGFTKQPTDYYLRPTNLAILPELYSSNTCYQEINECELYWDYLFDLLEAFQARGNQPHMTFVQEAALSHDYLNDIGYLDKPFHHLLERIFASGHQHNTVIFIYSDHHIRFGESMFTKAHLYEESLPVLYLYVPDSLTLSGQMASQLRDIVRANQHRLTNHFDLHATMLHLLNGEVPQSEPYGRSLLEPIPPNRTCDMAGIPPQFCLCYMYDPIEVTPKVINYSRELVTYMNKLMVAQGNSCVPLDHVDTTQAYKSLIRTEQNESFCQMYFRTKPNNGLFKGMVRLDDQDRVVNVEFFTRVNVIDDQSHCVNDKMLIESCYCWDIYVRNL